MALINDDNKEFYIGRLVYNQRHTHSEEEIRKDVEDNPNILEDFAEWYTNDREAERN